jgi:hypothetical protein
MKVLIEDVFKAITDNGFITLMSGKIAVFSKDDGTFKTINISTRLGDDDKGQVQIKHNGIT